VNIVKQKQVK